MRDDIITRMLRIHARLMELDPNSREAWALRAELEELRGETGEKPDQLEKQIRSYRNILKLNADNPGVREKLAELIAKAGRIEEADAEWAEAARRFFARGEYKRCIEILDDLVRRHPNDANLRERLSREILKWSKDQGDDEGPGVWAIL